MLSWVMDTSKGEGEITDYPEEKIINLIKFSHGELLSLAVPGSRRIGYRLLHSSTSPSLSKLPNVHNGVKV